jgi:hypothetical protein
LIYVVLSTENAVALYSLLNLLAQVQFSSDKFLLNIAAFAPQKMLILGIILLLGKPDLYL